MTFPHLLLALLLAFLCGASFVDLWHRRRTNRDRKALTRWRIRLGQLHEAHITARDAWTRQGNAKHTHRHAEVVKAAKALLQHVEGMPL